jgi:hypothetical protein
MASEGRMKKHDESRRAFSNGAAMGAGATTTLVPDDFATFLFCELRFLFECAGPARSQAG